MNEKTINELRNRALRHSGSYKRICDNYGVDYSWLSKFVNGKISNPTIRTVVRLQRALDQHESYITGG